MTVYKARYAKDFYILAKGNTAFGIDGLIIPTSLTFSYDLMVYYKKLSSSEKANRKLRVLLGFK